MTDLLTPIRSEHRCPACSGSSLPVSHMPVTIPADRKAATPPVSDLAALRSLLWYRGDLVGELA